MANMFSGNQEKRIPKDFSDCYKADGITRNLWLWSERLERWGFRICLFLAIWGVGSIITSTIEATTNKEDSLIIALLVITSVLKWILFCFLEYCAYHILALLVGSLASIVQHTKITANITLYNSAKAEGIADDDNAATENAKYVRKCNNKTHEIYISEIKDTNTNSENAHWEESKLTGVKKLVCNHCRKELIYIDNQEKTEEEETFSEEDYRDVRCPKCKQKLSVHLDEKNLICPFCETDIHVD